MCALPFAHSHATQPEIQKLDGALGSAATVESTLRATHAELQSLLNMQISLSHASEGASAAASQVVSQLLAREAEREAARGAAVQNVISQGEAGRESFLRTLHGCAGR